MYKVKFNTRDFHSKRNYRNWEDILRNDFAVAINGKEFVCDNETELKNRLSLIAGHNKSTDNTDYFVLEDEKYGKQYLDYAMYGFSCGYVDINKEIKQVNEKGNHSIPFSNFYDLRQCNFFNRCFVEIEKV